MGKGWGRRRSLIVALIAALAVVPAVLILTQQRAASAGTILSILDGSASVARGAAAFAVASDGDIVNIGDRVQTADRSHAVVTFFDGSTLEIEPATTVQVEEASSAASGAMGIRIAQTLGRTWASVQKLAHADSKFELRTPTLTAAVRGTGFITEVLADGTSTVQTTDGTVQVTAQGQSVNVGPRQTATALPNSPPTVPTLTTPANRLRFGLHSPAYLAVVDPVGRACGIVLPGPTVVRQIPGCLVTDPGTEPQLIDFVPDLPGAYQLSIASIAPGGAFVATASAVDGAGGLSFNYAANGSGQPGDIFGSRIDVASGVGGALTSNGLAPLTAIARASVNAVLRSTAPRPTSSGAPDTALFSPLPGIGFAVGATTAPLQTAAPSLTPVPGVSVSPLPTLVLPTAAAPTAVPTAVTTSVPTNLPTAAPTAAPTLAPTPTSTPTPQPTPTPLPPTLSGGSAPVGGTLPVLGERWPAGAPITITWPDGSQIATADVLSNGQFATRISVPATALPGTTYSITARGGGLTATADVLVMYSPTLTLSVTGPVQFGTPVQYSGGGWPPTGDYTILFDGNLVASSKIASGRISGSFVVPRTASPGVHTVKAVSGVYTASASLTTQ